MGSVDRVSKFGRKGYFCSSPDLEDLDKTATLSVPPARDAFPWPSFPSARSSTPPQFEPITPSSAFKYRLPSLDFSTTQAGQAGQYWPGATSSTPASSIPPSNTLPTPPTADTDVFKPPGGSSREGLFNSDGAVAQHSGMSSNLEPSGASSSLTARRSAASNLPNFELPPPQPLTHKFHPFGLNGGSIHNTQTSVTALSVGNLLTPPTNIPGDSLSPISSGVNSVSPAAGQGAPPYTPNSYWPQQGAGTTPYATFGTGTTPQPWAQGPGNPLFPRGLFSPSLGSLVRNSSNSPTASEGLPPPPPYDLNQLPPFPVSAPMSAPANLPAITQQQVMGPQPYMNYPTPLSVSQARPSLLNTSEPYLQPQPPTPTYYNGSQPSSTPQQTNFPAFHNASPVQQSPMSASTQGPRISPHGNQSASLQPTPLHPGTQYGRSYPTYSLPAMNGPTMTGPIMSNVHNPGNQMAMIGMPHHPGPVNHHMLPNFNSGHSALMYGPQAPTSHNERPFKCDQCPQSFNRNHDLKRHKRIHLAVKPFPCGHCEKSFSRKDALKVSFPALLCASFFRLTLF